MFTVYTKWKGDETLDHFIDLRTEGTLDIYNVDDIIIPFILPIKLAKLKCITQVLSKTKTKMKMM